MAWTHRFITALWLVTETVSIPLRSLAGVETVKLPHSPRCGLSVGENPISLTSLLYLSLEALRLKLRADTLKSVTEMTPITPQGGMGMTDVNQ